jgi:hypothetical protein
LYLALVETPDSPYSRLGLTDWVHNADVGTFMQRPSPTRWVACRRSFLGLSKALVDLSLNR